MNYVVSKNPFNKMWVINSTATPEATFGTHIGFLRTKREAVQCAKLLAGWRGTVEVHHGGRRAAA